MVTPTTEVKNKVQWEIAKDAYVTWLWFWYDKTIACCQVPF